MAAEHPPWSSGPAEILKHGLELLEEDSDSNRRLAMIAIDNSVELIIKTYLGLPRRITGLGISRREYQEISESFPALLDALERHAHDKIIGIDLGTIEWFHRLRNQLYHQGNGLTVERGNVEVYSALANELFHKLFGVDLIKPRDNKAKLLAQFFQSWTKLETELHHLAFQHSLTGVPDKGFSFAFRFLSEAALILEEDQKKLRYYQQIRNKIVHHYRENENLLNKEMINDFKKLVAKFTFSEE